MEPRRLRPRSLRWAVSSTAMVVLALPTAAITVLLAVYLRDQAMRPESAVLSTRYLCSSAAMSYRKADRPDVEPWIEWAASQNCSALSSEPIPPTAGLSTGGPAESIASVPAKLGDLARGGPADADTPVTCLARSSSVYVVPRLSLWPLTDPEQVGTTIVFDTGQTRDLGPEAAEFSSTLHTRVAAAQRSLNTSILLSAGGAVLVVFVFGVVVWTATGRVLRPVEAIRRQMADITASDLTRRVPVPAGRNEIVALARSVNATLDRLEAAVQDNRRFVADASHELRGPIAALRAELEIATAHPGLTDWPAVVDAALADTHRLQHLATDLLLLARLDHGDTTDHVDTVDLAALVRDRGAHHRGRHTVTVDVPEHPVPVRGRRPLLDRLLGNLLDNAERHATATIALRLTTRDGQAVLEVLDDGPGIPPGDRDRVFDRFTRLDHARARDAGGTGLGLSIVRRIAATHAGTVHATDHPDGTGARLVVALPLSP